MTSVREPMTPAQYEDAIQQLIEQFAARVEADTKARFNTEYPALEREGNWNVEVKPGRFYTRLDVGRSGKYMVENQTGRIFGIKAYGVIHRGHQYGTLQTVNDWQWGGYVAHPKRGDNS